MPSSRKQALTQINVVGFGSLCTSQRGENTLRLIYKIVAPDSARLSIALRGEAPRTVPTASAIEPKPWFRRLPGRLLSSPRMRRRAASDRASWAELGS